MDFKELCSQINRNKSTKLHNYYQKLLVFLFINNKDPFDRVLKNISTEKRIGNGVVDIYAEWEKDGKRFDEIIEVELGGKKKNLESKIRLYSKKADLLSICIPSKRLDSLISVFPKMRKDLTRINIVYLIDDEVVTKNRRKMTTDHKILVGAQSPFFIMKSKTNFAELKEFINSKKNLFFDALLPIYLK